MKNIITTALKNAMTYQDYRELHLQNVKEKSTTGATQSEALIDFTKLNNSRTRRWEKTYKPAINAADYENSQKEIWLTITETWCGDAAQNIPVLQKIAEALPNVETKFVLRDENLDLMDEFLTNGGRSIPKLVRLNAETLDVLGTWGPRPAALDPLLVKYKTDEDYTKNQFSEDVARFYVEDKGKSIEAEMLANILVPEIVE